MSILIERYRRMQHEKKSNFRQAKLPFFPEKEKKKIITKTIEPRITVTRNIRYIIFSNYYFKDTCELWTSFMQEKIFLIIPITVFRKNWVKQQVYGRIQVNDAVLVLHYFYLYPYFKYHRRYWSSINFSKK